MWEAVTSVLGGGFFGGLLRAIPEVLRFFDAKNDRAHELKMQEMELRFQLLRYKHQINMIETEGQMDWNTGALSTLRTAIESAARPSGIRWVDGWNAMIRPLIATQWAVLLYPGVLVATFLLYVAAGQPPLEALVAIFGAEEKAIASGIISFYFLGRVFDKVRFQK